MARGAHQHVALDLSFTGNISGHTQLTIVPTDAGIRTIYLHAREIYIRSVTYNENPIAFSHSDPLVSSSRNNTFIPSQPDSLKHAYPELKRKLFAASSEAEEGELAILLPEDAVNEVKARPENINSSNQPLDAPTPTPQAGNSKSTEFEPISITIYYEIRRSNHGINFVGLNDSLTEHVPHMYTTGDSARCWVPCVDDLWERCTWELDFVTPRYLVFEEDISGETEQLSQRIDRCLVSVVSSGELIERVSHPTNPDQLIFSYVQGTPASVHHIGFAAGPFDTIDLSPSQRVDDPDAEDEVFEDSNQPSVRAFCLVGRHSELVNSTSFLRKAMEFFISEYGSYPFGSYKLVFVDETIYQSFNTAALSIFSSDLLYPSVVIEQSYQTRQVVTHALACQWIGVNIIQRSWADTWLINGLSLYISSLYLRELLGNNEYRLRLKKDIMRCCALDIRMPPLCQPGLPYPPPPDLVPFINLKAPLVLHILDRQLLRLGTSMGLSRVIPRLFISSISGDLRDNLLSTSNFIRICRRVGGAELRLFSEQWIYSAGCPRFLIKANFNRKKMAVEMSINQDCPAYTYVSGQEPIETSHLRPNLLFEGTMTIRIHEADGTPYEHVLDIRDSFKRHDVPFNTKYKRVRRNTKRFQMRQAAAVAAANGDAEAAEELGLIDMGFGLGTWEEEAERDRWKVADWTEEDDQIMSQATYEWIRVDADLDWICTISFEQPDYMWISQLQRDRDVVAQLEAIHAISQMPSAVVSSNLTRTVLVDKYFFRIRAEAALMLTTCAREKLDYIGLFHLFKLFKSRYCFDPDADIKDAFEFRCIPRSNDFSDIAEYFVGKAIITAISAVRDSKGNSHTKVQQFLVELLTFNDNSQNPYSDAFYISSILNNLANSLVSVAPVETNQLGSGSKSQGKVLSITTQHAVDEIERYMSMDRLVSSYHNVITQAGLEAKAKLMMASELPMDPRVFLPYTRDGNFVDVRTTAFNALLLLGNVANPLLLNYFFAVLRSDSSILMQRRLSQSLVDLFPVLVALDDLTSHHEQKGFIEDDSSRRLAQTDNMDPVRVQKTLRKEIGRVGGLRELLLAAIMSPDLDLDVRWSMLRLCEIFVKPANEPLPKIKIPSSFLANLGPQLDSSELNQPKAATDAQRRAREDSPDLALPLRLSLITNKKKDKQKKSTKEAIVGPDKKPGMLMQEVISCQRIQRKVWSADNLGIFHTAVDPVKHNAPHYFDIIKNPMDLSVMAYKLDNNHYWNRQEYVDDFKLMISNAKTYNRPGQLVYKVAEKIDELFEKEWAKTLKSLAKLEERERTAAGQKSNVPATGTGTVKLSLGGSVNKNSTTSSKKPSNKAQSPPPPPSLKLKSSQNGKAHASEQSAPPVKPILKLKSSTSSNTSPEKKLHIVEKPTNKEKVKVKDPPKSHPPKKNENTNKNGSTHTPKNVHMAAPSQVSKAERQEMDRVKRDSLNIKKAKASLKFINQSEFSYWFKEPVDPQFAPGYFDEIKHPMDLRTMSDKLDRGKYETYGDFFTDFDLIMKNCRIFNPPTQDPTIHSHKLESVWVQHWKKALKMSTEDKAALKKVHDAVWSHPNAMLFHQAVDPNTTVPYYYDVIPQDQARDLSLIRTKLNSGRYDSVDEYEADMRLMFHNARRFNGPDSEVATVWTPPLEEILEKEMSKLRAGSTIKRKGDGDNRGKSKKVRVG